MKPDSITHVVCQECGQRHDPPQTGGCDACGSDDLIWTNRAES